MSGFDCRLRARNVFAWEFSLKRICFTQNQYDENFPPHFIMTLHFAFPYTQRFQSKLCFFMFLLEANFLERATTRLQPIQRVLASPREPDRRAAPKPRTNIYKSRAGRGETRGLRGPQHSAPGRASRVTPPGQIVGCPPAPLPSGGSSTQAWLGAAGAAEDTPKAESGLPS